MNNTQKKILLSELWENAAFDADMYAFLEKIAKDNTLFEALKPKIYDTVATLRNRNIITSLQQKKLVSTVVVFYGLSVGSHAAITWEMESRAGVVKISDPDIVTPTNLNRLRYGWDSVGKKKTDLVKKNLQSINPYVQVMMETKTTQERMRALIINNPHVHVIVDEIDDLVGKIYLRRLAKKYSLPLLSATDVGDNIILDIERYDLSPQPKPFLGRVVDLDVDKDYSTLTLNDRIRLTMQIIGFEICSEELIDSLLEIGEKLKTWPQLGATATIAGGVITTAIKKIVLGENIRSGRYFFSLDNVLVKDDHLQNRQKIRNAKEKKFFAKYSI